MVTSHSQHIQYHIRCERRHRLVTCACSSVEVYDLNGMAIVVNGIKSIDYDIDLPSMNDVASYDLSSDPDELINLTHPASGC